MYVSFFLGTKELNMYVPILLGSKELHMSFLQGNKETHTETTQATIRMFVDLNLVQNFQMKYTVRREPACQ
ncbi:hypothetical protein EYF80_058836 [Liparis tanakae]|uniref:Uncharacterized protein n=1 Tax=Liparis tanakae TaxID=230148 RepID=A0A4Z2EQE8_9TELE|nr:hypothetical protein EYF80_058836 [Liparis tanakae]